MLNKGKFQTRDGRTAVVYGRSHWNPKRWAGRIEGMWATTEWNDNGLVGETENERDIVL